MRTISDHQINQNDADIRVAQGFCNRFIANLRIDHGVGPPLGVLVIAEIYNTMCFGVPFRFGYPRDWNIGS